MEQVPPAHAGEDQLGNDEDQDGCGYPLNRLASRARLDDLIGKPLEQQRNEAYFPDRIAHHKNGAISAFRSVRQSESHGFSFLKRCTCHAFFIKS